MISCVFLDWSDDMLFEACALKLKLWEDIGQKFTPNNFLLGELEEKQIFELSNLVYMFSHKVQALQMNCCTCLHVYG